MTTRTLFAALGVAACLLGASVLGSAQTARQDPGRRRPFVHRRHVPKVWARGDSQERLRDCRGCHVFSETGIRDPQAACLECHLVTDANQSTFRPHFEPGWETLDNYRDENGLFRHHTHAALACRECHQPEEKTAVDPMPIRRGSAECTRCHGLGAADTPIEFVPPRSSTTIPDSARQLLLEELNRNPNMAPDRLGAFFHSEHLTDPQASFDLETLTLESEDTGRCTSCHSPVLEAGIEDFHANRFRPASCGECHIGRNGPLEFGATTEASLSLAALTFSHAEHLTYDRSQRDISISSSRGYVRIEEQGCHACHEYDQELRNFVVTDAASHEGCRSCHVALDWKAGQHGDWQGWGCTSCHTFEQAGGLAQDRPLASVRRRRAERFLIEDQVHPHISGDKTELSERSCRECHRARVDQLPSRLGARAFRHATHLPANPDPAQCVLCHGPRVAQAQTSAAISEQVDGRAIQLGDAALAPLLGLTYDLRACVTCHRGGTPVPVQVAYEEIEPAQVTDFSHAQHLGKTGLDGAPLDCLSCHRPDDREGGIVGTLPAASACVQCHDHRPGPASEISGQASAEDLSRCSRCHVGTIPAAGGQVPVERERLTSLKGSDGQFHPEDRDCNACHQAEWIPFSEADIVQADHVFAEGGRHLRRGTVVEKEQHQDGFLKHGQGTLCLMCHWAATVTSFDFESEANREDWGDLMQRTDEFGDVRAFPGGGYRAKFGGR